jgi:hypothetical protein
MVDDSSPTTTPSPPEVVPQFIARIRDPESVAPHSLSASPSPPPVSDIEKVLGLIVDRISAIEKKFGYMQDVIEGHKPNIPKAGVGLVLVPRTHVPDARALTSGPPLLPSTTTQLFPWIDDDDQVFPPLQGGVGRKAVRKANNRTQAAVQNASVPGALAQGNNSFIPVHPRIQMSFATTMKSNIMNHNKASSLAKQARETQKWNPLGHIKAGYSNAPMGFTDVVVIWNRGVEDREVELAFRKRHPTDIAQAVQ